MQDDAADGMMMMVQLRYCIFHVVGDFTAQLDINVP